MNQVHEGYMKRVLELARMGEGKTSPNPLVGCVIVQDGKIIAEGYHERYGAFHAERTAINRLRASSFEGDLADATLYVNLEPCCHHGKTPPCTDIIIESGIRRVVVGAQDANEQVNGSGIELLRKAGIEVITGILEEECLELNHIFYHYIRHKRPLVLMKYAMTMDGKIASYTGHSKWITSEDAREQVQKTRNRYAAIMVGIGTVLKDDPLLTCRMEGGRNPVRIICDSALRTPLDSRILQTSKEVSTLIATSCEDQSRIDNVEQSGAKIVRVSKAKGNSGIDLNELMQKLGEMGIDSILLEGGGELNFSALEARIVQRMQCYIAPKIIGGSEAVSPVGGNGIANVNRTFVLKNKKIRLFANDILIESEVDYSCLQE